MKRISVDNIDEGMVLGKDICGPSGNILLAKGTAVSPSLGRRLKNWGIVTISIEGEDEQSAAQEGSAVSSDDIKKQLEAKFSRCFDSAIMKELFAAVFQYRIRKNQ